TERGNGMTPCVDLRTFPPYRCYHKIEQRQARRTDDPWDLIIPGRSGFVAPFGGEYLLACTRGSTMTRKILAAVPDAVVHQDASGGANIKLHARHLGTVAPLLRLKRRRQLTAERQRRQAEQLRGFRFRPAAGAF